MARCVLGYDAEGHKIWSDNLPAENVGWGHRLGGRAIEEAPPPSRRYDRSGSEKNGSSAAVKGWETRRKLRGENVR